MNEIGKVSVLIADISRQTNIFAINTSIAALTKSVMSRAAKEKKEVEFVTQGEDVELDRAIMEAILRPIWHLLINAVHHGIEPLEERAALGKKRTGRVILSVKSEQERLLVEVEDDGRGIDPEKIKKGP